MMLTDLATACRKSGLKVVEVDGWKSRGHGQMTSVKTIVCHHTATAKSASGDYPSLRIVRDGRPDLDGPLAQIGLGRNGTVYVIAAGVCYHAGATFETRQNNWNAIGIEAEHDGISPWPAELVDAYARLVRALASHYKVSVANVQGHKEVAKPLGRKSDPNFDMKAFRARVAKAPAKPPKKLTSRGWMVDQGIKLFETSFRLSKNKAFREEVLVAIKAAKNIRFIK
jgi:hypothetical protein